MPAIRYASKYRLPPLLLLQRRITSTACLCKPCYLDHLPLFNTRNQRIRFFHTEFGYHSSTPRSRRKCCWCDFSSFWKRKPRRLFYIFCYACEFGESGYRRTSWGCHFHRVVCCRLRVYYKSVPSPERSVPQRCWFFYHRGWLGIGHDMGRSDLVMGSRAISGVICAICGFGCHRILVGRQAGTKTAIRRLDKERVRRRAYIPNIYR